MTVASQPQLRVLAVTNMYPTVSDPVYGTFIQTQMQSIAKLGLDVSVEFIDGRRGAWRYAPAISRLLRVATRKRYDVVHAHYGLTGFVAAAQRLPLVVSFCGDDLLGTPDGRGGLTIKSRLTISLARFAARRADAIICKSDQMRNALQSQGRRAHVIPNGVDTDLFTPGSRLEARNKLGLGLSDHLVMFPNTPTERRKRLDLAQASVEAVSRMGVSCRLWVVDKVPPAQMPVYYRAANCLLLTSDWEGSPNVVKEALSCDLPVVSVNVGDVPRWLSLVSGCKVVERSPQAIAAGLQSILSCTTSVDGTHVREALDLAVVARRVVAVYREAIEYRHSRRLRRDGTV